MWYQLPSNSASRIPPPAPAGTLTSPSPPPTAEFRVYGSEALFFFFLLSDSVLDQIRYRIMVSVYATSGQEHIYKCQKMNGRIFFLSQDVGLVKEHVIAIPTIQQTE